ncbi:MAG: hypothetical protein Kow00120_00420 [Anaerolineae bacterium]
MTMTADKTRGPKVMELIFHKVARDAVPPGDGIAAGIAFLSDVAGMKASFRAAFAWADAVIAAVKAAPDNPYGDDDEAIAAAILDRLEDAAL